MRVFQLSVKDQIVGWLAQMGPFSVAGRKPDEAVARLIECCAQRQLGKEISLEREL